MGYLPRFVTPLVSFPLFWGAIAVADPSWSQNPIVLPNGNDVSPYSETIAPFAIPENPTDQLTFSSGSDAPSWLTIDPSGDVSGSPAVTDVGNYSFSAFVTDQTGATVATTVQITVVTVGPQWNESVITLPAASTGFGYSEGVFSYVNNPANSTLSFSITGPSWASIDPNAGVISGTPTASYIGLNTFQVSVFDETGTQATTSVQINVGHLPPSWTSNPIILPNANDDAPYTASIGQYAVASDPNDSVNITGGSNVPFWLSISSQGVITGNPSPAQVGNVTFTVIATDQAGATATATVQLTVTAVNLPPAWTANQFPFSTPEDQPFSTNIAANAQDPISGNSLRFSLVSGPSWLTVSPTGSVTGTPVLANEGPNVFVLRVTDNYGIAATPDAQMTVTVTHVAPRWSQNPIVLPSTNDSVLYSTNVSGDVISGDPRDTLTLTLGSDAPLWLTVASDGTIQGTAPIQLQQNNNYTFSITATDQTGSSATTQLQLLVTASQSTVPVTDVVTLENSVPGAALDQLWVIDNHLAATHPIEALKRNISSFYESLDTSQVHFSDVFLSSNAAVFNGSPIQGEDGLDLMLWSVPDISRDFLYRLHLSRTAKREGIVDNSPIWSLYQFYQQVTQIPSLWPTGYFAAGIPMDVMIVGNDIDHFSDYSEGVAGVNQWSAPDFAHSFTLFHQKTEQSYRISVVSSQCSASTAVANAYQTLSNITHGTCYPLNDSSDMSTALNDYAAQVTFHAAIESHGKLPLSQSPYSTTPITVTIGGHRLIGNTGALSDQWAYDSVKNEVVINWSLIDDSAFQPRDQILIQYETRATPQTNGSLLLTRPSPH